MRKIKPTCPKCESTTFALAEIQPHYSRHAMLAVCCADCGAVVGTEPCNNVVAMLRDLAGKLNITLD